MRLGRTSEICCQHLPSPCNLASCTSSADVHFCRLFLPQYGTCGYLCLTLRQCEHRLSALPGSSSEIAFGHQCTLQRGDRFPPLSMRLDGCCSSFSEFLGICALYLASALYTERRNNQESRSTRTSNSCLLCTDLKRRRSSSALHFFELLLLFFGISGCFFDRFICQRDLHTYTGWPGRAFEMDSNVSPSAYMATRRSFSSLVHRFALCLKKLVETSGFRRCRRCLHRILH